MENTTTSAKQLAFEHKDFGVLRVAIDQRTGQVSFALEDVCRALGISESDALALLDPSDMSTVSVEPLSPNDIPFIDGGNNE